MKRVLAISPIVIVLLAIVMVLANNKKKIEAKNVVKDRSAKAVAVVTEEAKVLPIAEIIQSPATLTASSEASISTLASGRIVSLNIQLGQQITKGQVLGRMDVRETEIKLQSAELDIQRLKREVDRNKILVEGNAISTKAMQDSKFDLESKIIEAEQLKKQISNGNIVAAISGIVVEKSKEAGEYVGMGEVIGKVVNTSSLKARVFLPENKVIKLAEGQHASITTEAFPGEIFKGVISYISPQGDENHNYEVELSIENKNNVKLRAGMYGMIKFSRSAKTEVLQVSKAALINGLQNPEVFVAQNNKASRKKIVTGREIGDKVEVLSGLTPGEQVIVNGQINLVDGSNVSSSTNL